jgi:murein DD-endopeptidase MepM/ murein hydrolase activator NlpD
MVVVRHAPDLWTRYAHITPVVRVGEHVEPGDKLGAFADWRTGDHLHLDMRSRAYTREWLSGDGWLNPIDVLMDRMDADWEINALVRDDRS